MLGPPFEFFDPPSLDAEVDRVLTALAAGGYDPDELESASIDLKEEAGRRSNG